MRLSLEDVFIRETQERRPDMIFDLGPRGFVEYRYGNQLMAWHREEDEEEGTQMFYIDSQYDGVGPLHAWRCDGGKSVEEDNWDYEFSHATIMGDWDWSTHNS